MEASSSMIRCSLSASVMFWAPARLQQLQSHQKRPADVIGNAIRVAKIATGEEQEDFGADDGKDKAAQSMGRRGGAARAKALSPKRRAEIARNASAKRWKKG